MALFTSQRSGRDEIVAIDLGYRITKAVYLRRKGTVYHLQNYVLMDAPIFDQRLSTETLAAHLKTVWQALNTRNRHVVLVMGASNAFLWHAELPAVSASDLRHMVKLSPKTYLQQDLPDYLFDCYSKNAPSGDTAFRTRTGTAEETTFRTRRKLRALVCGAKIIQVEDLKEAARQAGLVLQRITLSQVGLVNAFKMLPEDSHGEVVALLDIGFHHSTISIVTKGNLALTRIVNLGAERFAEAMNQPPDAEAPGTPPVEGLLTEAIQNKLQHLIIQLVKEVDASIGFFVSQQEVTVNQVCVSGGSARSQFIVQTLEVELGLPCETWNPTRSLTLDLPPRQQKEIDYDAAQLAVAIGAGLGLLNADLVPLNLLAEEQAAAEMRRRDPVRRGFQVAAAAVLAVLVWAGCLGLQLWKTNQQLAETEAELKMMQNGAKESLAITGLAGETERTLAALERLGSNRFLYAPTLNALQFTTLPEIQFHRLKIEQTVVNPTAGKPGAIPAKVGAGASRGPPPPTIEKTVLTIQAKNYGDAQAVDKFIETVSSFGFFTNLLRHDQPVLLKDLLPRQVDPADPGKSFVFFTTEHIYSERILKDE